MRRVARILFLFAVCGIGLAAAVAWWSQRWLQAPMANLQERTVFEIPRGAPLRAVAAELHSEGLLEYPDIWIAWARLTDRAGRLRAGEYELAPGLTPSEALELFNSGRVLLHSITFVEGSTFADVRNTLTSHPAVRADYAKRSDAAIMAALGQPELHPEGQFFPDTYHFARGTPDLALLRMAHERMTTELDAAWEARAPDLPLASPYEALTLASIIEKETALEQERRMIAGVFLERLRLGMRLQTDPTVIYGMQEQYDGNIRRVDLQRDTPYNTYTRSGLPPTPIALPGLESLHAAVQPEDSDALFFVATGEPDGSHYFSKTLTEHNAAVRRYLRKLREQARTVDTAVDRGADTGHP